MMPSSSWKRRSISVRRSRAFCCSRRMRSSCFLPSHTRHSPPSFCRAHIRHTFAPNASPKVNHTTDSIGDMCSATMDTKKDSADMNEKMGDGHDGKPKSNDPLATASRLPDDPSPDPTERVSTEATEPPPTDISVDVIPEEETNEQPDTTAGEAGEAGASVSRPAARAQPKKARRARDPSRSAKSTRKSQRNLKVTAVRAQPGGDDLCAATLLACLFCHPLDCFVAGSRGCVQCVWCLCSFRWVCDCSVCLPAPECLDLAVEFSQTLYR
ncbi:hypothetical protein EYF80_022447 [Liparis tanakae]|uniref:Uncharacterized protein n=1 Tax=Liparis tanakae TaxID=230148 RepID=A0A4Z2HP31_9TELE|nr:hypothetical protein EYF80_022447 [Liparis tanakae]